MNDQALKSTYPAHPSVDHLTAEGLMDNSAGRSEWYRRKYRELQFAFIESDNAAGKLGKAIQEAAEALGVVESGTTLSGPHLLMVLDDIKALAQRARGRPVSLDEIQKAYVDAFYEGLGDDHWYSDHDADGNLLPGASVYGPMSEYLQSLEQSGEQEARAEPG